MSILARSESLRLDAYPDGKLWTIGWGTTRIGGKPVVDGMKITWSEANDLLNRDLRQFEQEVEDMVEVEMTGNQFSALVCFVYNIGGDQFRNSTLLKFLNQGEYEKAAQEFPRWVHSKGKRLPGLAARRRLEMELFLTE